MNAIPEVAAFVAGLVVLSAPRDGHPLDLAESRFEKLLHVHPMDDTTVVPTAEFTVSVGERGNR